MYEATDWIVPGCWQWHATTGWACCCLQIRFYFCLLLCFPGVPCTLFGRTTRLAVGYACFVLCFKCTLLVLVPASQLSQLCPPHGPQYALAHSQVGTTKHAACWQQSSNWRVSPWNSILVTLRCSQGGCIFLETIVGDSHQTVIIFLKIV